MNPVNRRNIREGGFLAMNAGELIVFSAIVYGAYFSVVLPIAGRIHDRGTLGWWAIVLGPLAACLLLVSPYSIWCWRKGKDTSTFENTTAVVGLLELLLIVLVMAPMVWKWLTSASASP